MRTRLLKLSCKQTINRKVSYFLTQQADIGQDCAAYGAGHPIRISRRTASALLGWVNTDRIGSADSIAVLTVSIS